MIDRISGVGASQAVQQIPVDPVRRRERPLGWSSCDTMGKAHTQMEWDLLKVTNDAHKLQEEGIVLNTKEMGRIQKRVKTEADKVQDEDSKLNKVAQIHRWTDTINQWTQWGATGLGAAQAGVALVGGVTNPYFAGVAAAAKGIQIATNIGHGFVSAKQNEARGFLYHQRQERDRMMKKVEGPQKDTLTTMQIWRRRSEELARLFLAKSETKVI